MPPDRRYVGAKKGHLHSAGGSSDVTGSDQNPGGSSESPGRLISEVPGSILPKPDLRAVPDLIDEVPASEPGTEDTPNSVEVSPDQSPVIDHVPGQDPDTIPPAPRPTGPDDTLPPAA